MFNTDSVIDVILYSGEVLKFCKSNPFNQKCKEYYDKIQNLQSLQNAQNTSVESLGNRIIIGNSCNNDNNGYILIIYLVLVLVLISLLVLFLKRDLTESNEIKQTNIETNTSNNMNI